MSYQIKSGEVLWKGRAVKGANWHGSAVKAVERDLQRYREGVVSL